MTIPHIYIRKGAILKGVDLIGLNVVFELEKLPPGGNDDGMQAALNETIEYVEDVFITKCRRSTNVMLAEVIAKQAIDAAIAAAKEGAQQG